MAGQVRVVDARTMRVKQRLATPLLASHDNVVPTRDGRLVVVGDQAIVAFDLATGRRLWAADLRDRLFPEPCPFFALAEEVGRMYCGSYFGQLDERDLSTGERTGVRLDPQLGSVGDLATSHNGRELIAFGAGGASVYSRWRLDGSGLISTAVAEDQIAVGGFNPTGDSLLVADQSSIGTEARANSVIDASTGAVRATLPGTQSTWSGPSSVVVLGSHRNGVYDLLTRAMRRSPALTPQSQEVWRELDSSHVWVAQFGDDGSSQVTRLDAETGQPTGEPISVEGFVQSVVTSPDGQFVYITYTGSQDWTTSVFDAESGSLEREGLPGQARLAMSSAGVLVGADTAGAVTEFDATALEPIATFPGARGAPHSLQFSADGAVLLVTTGDQSVQVYDVASRTRLGDAITSAAVNDEMEGWIRPDGHAVAVNGRLGVAVWSLDPAKLTAAACVLAGRNLTRTEWETYLGPDTPYRASCPQFAA
jgi:WD40 repeat protein